MEIIGVPWVFVLIIFFALSAIAFPSVLHYFKRFINWRKKIRIKNQIRNLRKLQIKEAQNKLTQSKLNFDKSIVETPYHELSEQKILSCAPSTEKKYWLELYREQFLEEN
jgi:hypothetical protein